MTQLRGTTPEERLEELGLTLPEPPSAEAAYKPYNVAGQLIFTAGQLPVVDGRLPATGKVGAEVTLAEAEKLARQAAVNVLAQGRAAAGDLARLRVVKLTVFVASTPDFTDQHLVANGASELLAAVLGEDGRHARSAVGVPVLPLDSPVEVEAVLEVRG
jgi:enamine deaminase RidA (YjgF/YER057c/UK114 family)